MNVSNNTELLNHLAMAYAVGTLRGHARLRFESMAREQPKVRAAIQAWQTNLASLNELQAPVQPNEAVWWRINQQINASLAKDQSGPAVRVPSNGATNEPNRWWRNLGLWQGTALAFAIASLAIGLSRQELQNQLTREQAQVAQTSRALEILKSTPAPVRYVAVLLDQKASEALLVTVDPEGRKVAVKRVGTFREDGNKSLQLWALGANAKPKSLGVLTALELEQVLSALVNPELASALAVSLEPKGGVPEAGGPTGPVLFKGALLKTSM